VARPLFFVFKIGQAVYGNLLKLDGNRIIAMPRLDGFHHRGDLAA
jgi:hypothetical protein